ncbi:MAG: UvrD-helicase domain-containing protein [Magnetococcales bacterium]|nr:UvrD-helicase domain-containing protein [Magnetococcales bacterium]
MLEDAEVRTEVLDPLRSFIVQAPAGSGKTGILTQRFLRLLAGVEHPEEVVAITFTRKAAAEMRDRILEALRQGSNTPAPQDDHAQRTHALARNALTRDQERQWHLVNHPARLRVVTIDSLCASIARQMPLSSGMGVPPGHTREAENLYRQAARSVLAHLEDDDRWSPSVARLLDHLDNDPGRSETLLADLLARRDQWLRFLSGGTLDRRQLEAALAAAVREPLCQLVAALPPGMNSTLPELLRFAANHLPAESTASPLAAWREAGTEFPTPDPVDLPKWRGIASLLLTREGKWRSKVDRRQGFPPESAGGNPEEKKHFKTNKSRLMAMLETLSAIPELERLFRDVTTLPDPRYNDTQWEILQALKQLLPLAAAELRILFSARAEVDFTEVAMAAVRALGRDDEPTDLALRLDHKLRHLLVDEFQDTSQSQFQLLKQLTAGWIPNDGRTLFLVGDPMQSIYRFREAEVGLFSLVQRQGLGSILPASRHLSVNFRSDGGLVNWVNTLFKDLMPPGNDPLTGGTPFVAAHPFHATHDATPIALHPHLADDPQTETDQVIGTIRESLRNFPQKNIAILVRSRAHLGSIVPALRQNGIPFQAVEIAALAETSVVQDLYALTRALLHPADRIHWLAVLRAPWCGLTLTELHHLAGEDANRITLWESMHDPTRTNRLETASRARLERVAGILARAFQVRRRAGFHHGAGVLRRWIETTWHALGGPATCHGPEERSDALTFLNLLESLEKGGDIADFRRLDQGLRQLFASPAHPDARVQVMTIHKAKGLEFDTVILPGLDRRSRGSASRLLLWMERPTVPVNESLLLAPLKRSDQADPDPIYAFLANIDQEKERLETVRLLYVAVTRARRSLHLFGKADSGKAARGSFLHLMWPVVQEAFADGNPDATRSAAAADTPETEASSPEWAASIPPFVPPEMRRLPADWQPPPPLPTLARLPTEVATSRDDALIFDWAGNTVRCVGIVVHRWLQRVAREGITTWHEDRVRTLDARIKAQLTRLGVATPEITPAARWVGKALIATLTDPRGRWILDPRHTEARSELALTGLHNGRIKRVVLDRTFIDASNTRWIIDFKTSLHTGGDLEGFLDNEQERYREHMATYAALLRSLDDKPVRCGLYFPLVGGGWREYAEDPECE